MGQFSCILYFRRALVLGKRRRESQGFEIQTDLVRLLKRSNFGTKQLDCAGDQAEYHDASMSSVSALFLAVPYLLSSCGPSISNAGDLALSA
jgi:hypothetical protein